MANSLFTELSACEATSLVGGRSAFAFGTFFTRAVSNQGFTETNGGVSNVATVDGDNSESVSEGGSSAFAGED
ncbi:MAG: hypothetical protein RM368_07455 [Nostoc sp. DedSLP03]|uniref:hypothetical protein n=1 Tax=unclassified Nostoc TaxID=2593658 RepID=UPI002AD5AF6F|nr:MULTISPECIES: hypothetical protein [unclassified Nostoc]MDZ7964800.1 hypothetical protein [Nostoc sp. DedSLP03]MDZ8130615.1 hypothetical protein [Nostoc sp. DedQUE07]